VLCERCAAQSAAKSDVSSRSATTPSFAAHSNNSARPCLHGNLRLGHVHRNVGPFRSTVTLYGSRALP
jgi:hypothetical protein